MNLRTMIRYLRFRPAADGGRIFDFWISETDLPNREISVQIPRTFFEGQNRIHLQDGVGISSAKIKDFLESGESTKTHLLLHLNAVDLAQHRK